MDADRQPRGTAFALRDAFPWPTFAGLARTAEALGYRAVFLPEIAGRDAFAALTGLAGETGELLLGTGIVPMTSRSPRVTAMGVATVHERSGGRAILGLGTGPAARRRPRRARGPGRRAPRAPAPRWRAVAAPPEPSADLDRGARATVGRARRTDRRRRAPQLVHAGARRRGARGRPHGGRGRGTRPRCDHDRGVHPRVARGRPGGPARGAARSRRGVRLVPGVRAAVRGDGAVGRGRGGRRRAPGRRARRPCPRPSCARSACRAILPRPARGSTRTGRRAPISRSSIPSRRATTRPDRSRPRSARRRPRRSRTLTRGRLRGGRQRVY